MRLDKFLAQHTAMTRSQARKAIRRSEVCVDGVLVKDVGAALAPESQVYWQERRLEPQGPRYLMLHKPAGYVCSTDEPGHRLATDLLGEQASGLHYAGRLDADTTGLVLLTDDGQWSHRITSPRCDCQKRYRVSTERDIRPEDIEAFAEGVMLRGEAQPTLPAKLEILSERQALLWLSEGRYHQVKRMFAARGNHVSALHRESVGEIELDPKALPEGHFRTLSEAERLSV